MALHLVTGYAGKSHITAADQGALNAGIFGTKDYVVNTGNKFAAVPITANTIKILDGEVILHGRHIRMEAGAYEEVTVENGTADYKRHDLICIRYTKDSTTGTENASCVVVKGTPDASSAIDPNYNTGSILEGTLIVDFPLYRVPLDGLNIGDLVQLFEVQESLADRAAALETGKVDKVAGKGLSTNDYSDTEKQQVGTNKTDIANLKNGITPAGDSKKLNGLTAEEFVTNENLLINAYLEINSKGQTDYTTTGTCVDKWDLNYSGSGNSCSFNTVTKTLTCNVVSGDNYAMLRQFIYNPAELAGKTVTVSAKASACTGAWVTRMWRKKSSDGTTVALASPMWTSELEMSVTFTIPEDVVNDDILIVPIQTRNSVGIEWIKLELGSVATPFVPPNKEVEKLKCGATVGDAESVNGFKIYTDIADLGLTVTATISELWSALPNGSEFVASAYQFTDASWNFPETTGVLRVVRFASNRGYAEFNTTGGKPYRMGVNTSANTLDGNWSSDADTVNGFHVYGSLSDIGCTAASTLTEVYSAMAYPSMLILNSSQMTDASWNFPVTNLTVTIVKLSNIRGYLDAQHKNKNYTYRMGITDTDPALPDGTWDKIGYADELFPRTGGTLTDTLVIEKENFCNVHLKNSSFARDGSFPTTDIYSTVNVLEKNGENLGAFQNSVNKSGNVYTQMSAYRNSATKEYCQLGIKFGIDGTHYPFYRYNGTTEYKLLHTGNSQKVVITDSADDAPTETSGLWAY